LKNLYFQTWINSRASFSKSLSNSLSRLGNFYIISQIVFSSNQRTIMSLFGTEETFVKMSPAFCFPLCNYMSPGIFPECPTITIRELKYSPPTLISPTLRKYQKSSCIKFFCLHTLTAISAIHTARVGGPIRILVWNLVGGAA
jgi:hypothetical protein